MRLQSLLISGFAAGAILLLPSGAFAKVQLDHVSTAANQKAGHVQKAADNGKTKQNEKQSRIKRNVVPGKSGEKGQEPLKHAHNRGNNAKEIVTEVHEKAADKVEFKKKPKPQEKVKIDSNKEKSSQADAVVKKARKEETPPARTSVKVEKHENDAGESNQPTAIDIQEAGERIHSSHKGEYSKTAALNNEQKYKDSVQTDSRDSSLPVQDSKPLFPAVINPSSYVNAKPLAGNYDSGLSLPLSLVGIVSYGIESVISLAKDYGIESYRIYSQWINAPPSPPPKITSSL